MKYDHMHYIAILLSDSVTSINIRRIAQEYCHHLERNIVCFKAQLTIRDLIFSLL